MPIKLRLKYRQSGDIKRNQYKARTGPHCCNGGCGRRRKRGINWTRGSGLGK